MASAWYGSVGAAPPVEPAPEVPPATPTTVAPVLVGPQPPIIQEPPPIVDPIAASAPLIAVPSACTATAPPAPVAVFVGVLAAADSTTARFAVQQIRAGTLDGYAVDTIVDVRYDDDIRFLPPASSISWAPPPTRSQARCDRRFAYPRRCSAVTP